MTLSPFRSAAAVAVAFTVVSAPAMARVQQAGQQAQLGITTVVRNPGEVSGTAWYRDDTPVAYALLRLRNVHTGQVVMNGQADAAGRFRFTPVQPGSYLVELVDDNGRIRGVGQMFSIGPGETVATFIRLGADISWYHGFFTNAAAAALASAALLGVKAVGAGMQPASARN